MPMDECIDDLLFLQQNAEDKYRIKTSEDDEETSGGDDTPKGTHGNVVEDVKRDKGKRVLSQNEKYRAVSAACQRIAEGVAD
ncbi:hypothetical protein F443_05552 [Phytophthora nicotianae P1569]|uniref:Uncharacterized protein n=1 Tax=Phytophthora nicotianae P1569 TaxID=1317065 RepID=V9FIW8_PHYNI|nr:hypothetical protein F443_05552 [Phytophthora nicotianae P1569]